MIGDKKKIDEMLILHFGKFYKVPIYEVEHTSIGTNELGWNDKEVQVSEEEFNDFKERGMLRSNEKDPQYPK